MITGYMNLGRVDKGMELSGRPMFRESAFAMLDWFTMVVPLM
jgi:hypothetical protein